MKKIILLLSFLILPLTYAGDEVNNGGGISEANFANAYINLGQYINFCLSLPSCNVTPTEKSLLMKIKESLKTEYKSQNQLQFLSETQNPGTFIIEGQIKVAKTGDLIGSPIMVNTDLIYFENKNNAIKTPMSIAQATAIIIHEMGHHHGVENHDMLDLLGAKVSMALHQNIAETSLMPNSNAIRSVIINGKSETDFPQIMLYIFDKVIDVTEVFKGQLTCKLAGLSLPINFPVELTLDSGKPVGATFHNTYWHNYDFQDETAQITLRGNLMKYCDTNINPVYDNRNYKAKISVKLEKVQNDKGQVSWKYQENSLRVKEEYDPWWKIIRLPFSLIE